MKIDKYLPQIFVVSLFMLLLAPFLFSEGMFMDGLIYAGVSRNLAFGLGDFWNLHFSQTFATEFRGHPPLVFYLQSLFFKIFGDYLWVERLYSLTTGLATIFLIFLVWKKFSPSETKHFSWLPVLLWLTIPLVAWSYPNNILENTMLIFILLSILSQKIGIDKNNFAYFILAGFFTFAALFSKGFPSLFVWVFVPLHWLIFRKTKIWQVIFYTFLTITFTVLPLLLVLIVSEKAQIALQEYMDIQILKNISGETISKPSFKIVGRLFSEIAVSLIISGLLFIFSLKKIGKKPSIQNIKYFLFFVIIGLSASLPLVIATKQRGFYLTTSFPFFALGFAFLIIPIIKYLSEKINLKQRTYKFVKISLIGLFFVSIISHAFFWGKPARDKNKVSDVKKICAVVPENSIVSVSVENFRDWSLQAYFVRYANISLCHNKDKEYKYVIVSKKTPKRDTSNYQNTKLQLNNYFLFEKKY